MARILVVDDEKNLRLVVQKELTRLGHEVDVAMNGEDAWDLLEDRDFDVLLSDINMPKLDGKLFIERYLHRHGEKDRGPDAGLTK